MNSKRMNTLVHELTKCTHNALNSYYLYTMVQKRFGKGMWTHSSHVGISEYRGVAVVHSQGFFLPQKRHSGWYAFWFLGMGVRIHGIFEVNLGFQFGFCILEMKGLWEHKERRTSLLRKKNPEKAPHQSVALAYADVATTCPNLPLSNHFLDLSLSLIWV